MSTKDLLSLEIYPRLFDQIDVALPEFEFKRIPKGYQSTNGHKVSGPAGEKGKVYIYENNISRLIDYTRESMSVWDYVQERDKLTNGQTLQRLAEMAGFALPKDGLSEESIQSIAELNRKAELWEDANTFFRRCLAHPENQFAQSHAAEVLRNYLVDERGYAPHLFAKPDEKVSGSNPKIEIGFVPPLTELYNHLINEVGHPETDVQALLADEKTGRTDYRIGQTHRLAIPYRDPAGRIRGMVFRSVAVADTPKYLYSTGLDRKTLLFNLKAAGGDRELVIVEGQLDALHATAVGIPGVVAIGGSGSSLSKEHIQQAIRYGARRITLVLDPDSAGKIGTDKALELLRQFPSVRPYVAFVDQEHKDLDRLLTVDDGVEKARAVIAQAIDGWRYLLERVVDRYSQADELTDKQINSLLSDVVQTASGLSRIDSDLFIQRFVGNQAIQEFGITAATLQTVTDELRQAKGNNERDKAIRSLTDELTSLLQKGEGDKALTTLYTKGSEIKETRLTDDFKDLLKPATQEEVRDRHRQKPESLELGFEIDKIPVVIPAGALSMLVAPTSHGKTTLLINAVLNLAARYPKKRFDFFSYEEDADAIRLKMLNTYIDQELAYNNRDSISKFYADKRPIFFRDMAEVFHQKRAEFFNTLIESGRINIHYVSYDSDTLNQAIRYVDRTEGLGAVVIDYVQLLNLPVKKYQTYSRQEELKQICLDLKDLSVETGLPIILASQFNRTVTNLTHLHATKCAESGDIERSANLMLGIWNNDRKPLNPSDAEQKVISDRTYAKAENSWYVEVLKNRDGRVEHYDIWDYNGNTGKVKNLS